MARSASMAELAQNAALVNEANTFTQKQNLNGGADLNGAKVEDSANPSAAQDLVTLQTLQNFSFDAGTF